MTGSLADFFRRREDAGGRGGSYGRARQVCAVCSVRVRCHAEALAVQADMGTNEVTGMFGGASPQERVELRRQRLSRAAAGTVR